MENIVARDGVEELALFLEMRRHDKEDQSVSPLPEPGPSDANKTSSESSVPTTMSSVQRRRTAVEKFLDSENDKSDYEWLLASPETLCEKEPQKNSTVALKEPNGRSAVLKPRLENIPEEAVSRNVKASRRASLAPGMYSLTAVTKRTIVAAEPKPSTKPWKQVTPNSRTTLPSAKPNRAESRSSISTRSAPRSSTPSGRTTSSISSSLTSGLVRSSSVGKSAPGAKPTASKLSEMPGRSISASRGRAYSSAVKSRSAERPRGQSRSSNDVNPVLIGTKMVERVVNMRKLPPPKQDDRNSAGKSDSSGFGRTLSRSSFDMALRHMDITRSMR